MPPKPIEKRYNFADLRFDASKEIVPPIPVLSVSGGSIATAQNLTLIVGKQKTGKSGLISAIMAAMLKPDIDESERMYIDAAPAGGKAILHIDTEQAKWKHAKEGKKVLSRAALNACPSHFYSYTLRELPPTEKVQALHYLAQVASDECGGVAAIVIDGVTDLMQNVNDLAEASQTVQTLEKLAIAYDCPVIVVLHTNAKSIGSEARGHIGSELQRKCCAELNLSRKDAEKEEQTEIQFVNLRDAGSIPPVFFSYNHIKGYHTGDYCMTAAKKEAMRLEAEAAKQGYERDKLTLTMRDSLNGSEMAYNALKSAICTTEGISDGTAKNRIKKGLELDVIVKDEAKGTYSLNPKLDNHAPLTFDEPPF